MKNRLSKLIFFLSILFAFSSCVDFLDQTPDAVAFSDEEIFTNYEKSLQFIDQLYVPWTYFDDNDWWDGNGNVYNGGKFHGKTIYGLRERISDNCLSNSATWHTLNGYRNGNFSNPRDQYWGEGSELRFEVIWKAIRVCNMSIKNIDRIADATQDQKNVILGNAYFLRGHFYFMLLQGWGGMPYITEPMEPSQNMDMVRLSYLETARKIAEDFEKAATFLPMVVDAADWNRPSRMAAISYKAKALVWGASPFSNPDNNQAVWQEAAVATGKAIDEAEKSGYYKLVDLANFKKLFVDVDADALQEVIFGRLFNNTWVNKGPYYCGIRSSDFGSSWTGAHSVTENLAQSFTWSNGEPIDPTTNEYKTNPYYGDGVNHTGRDPRFYQTLLFNGATTPEVASKGRTVEIWNKSYNNVVAKELLVNAQGVGNAGYTHTGYYIYKLWSPAYFRAGNYTNIMINYIRMADLYLYYAEAANRAWGPNAAPQGIPGFTMTAVQALNKVRTRANMPEYSDASPSPWLKVGSVAEFEAKVRNESRVETCFEEKRFYDLRRWRMLTDPDVLLTKGLYIDRTGANSFTYTVVPAGVTYDLKYQERHYLFKIKPANTYLGPDFVQNPGW
jgi:starch-binding outer membrane protein, SusD/RagB family